MHRSNYKRLTPPTSPSYGEIEVVSHAAPHNDKRRPPIVHHGGSLNSNGKDNDQFRHAFPVNIDRKPGNVVVPMDGYFTSVPPSVIAEEFHENNNTIDYSFSKRNEHPMKSGMLGRCEDPFCTACLADYSNRARKKYTKESSLFDNKFGGARNWITKSISSVHSHIPVLNPHDKRVQMWNKFFVISCLVAIFIDPLFFFLLSVEKDNKCIILNWNKSIAIASVRTLSDFIYLLHMLLQFRLAYVARESQVTGTGDLIDQPKRIALHYVCSRFFWIDLFVVLPLPQIMILGVLPTYVRMGSGSANYAKNLLRAVILLQYFPRMYRFIPLLGGQSPSGFIFESAWANFVINLFLFVLTGHVVGSLWYLFGLQRVNQCLRIACKDANITHCSTFIDCGRGKNLDSFQNDPNWPLWVNSSEANNCFLQPSDFNYGIYQNAVPITAEGSIITKYLYSLFWGFQQISTLAGNQIPSLFWGELLFTMAIIGLGLLLFAMLIGNMQNFLQALGRRRVEMQLRRRDVERWMSHRRLPDLLRRKVRQSERFNWAATRGVNEEELLESLPEDLQREIRQHLFNFIKRVRIFTLMDDDILDAIRERLRPTLFIQGSQIIRYGCTIDKMFFIVRGKVESSWTESRNTARLSEGDVCGEELITWCLEHASVHKDGSKGNSTRQRLLSGRTVKCLSNVEAFSLHVNDLDEVTAIFARFLRNPRVQGAIRYESPHWRAMAASRIQVAWRYRKRRQLNPTSSFVYYDKEGDLIQE